MSNLLSDFVNDRLQPVATTSFGNRLVPNDDIDAENFEEKVDTDYDSDDSEQNAYVTRELESYSNVPETTTGLMDIIDGHEESLIDTEMYEMINVPKVYNMYKFNAYFKNELPIDSYKSQILQLINTNAIVIISGPTGCGKTTQVPQYILDECKAANSPCNIVVTQPRRIAAINISQRVCEERGWAMGTVCGYQVGLDKKVGDDVILTYVTTEVLLQKLIVQKNLNKYTHVIIDEVHERNKSLDFLLLIVRKYLFTNSPSVKVILMSATMDAEVFAYYFRTISRNNPQDPLLAPVLRVTKKSIYTTSIYYNEHISRIPTSVTFDIEEPCITPDQYKYCLAMVKHFDRFDDNDPVTGEPIIGSVLVFLPGFHEIEEMDNVFKSEKNPSRYKWEILPLHSSLTDDQLVRAFHKPVKGVRKIILSTNIAESSLTVPDVNYVIDFCLTKVMKTNPITKFSTLTLEWASHNNCIQRAGRVGRVANGRVYRLVPEDFYKNQMPAETVPELQRAPLENIILYMKLLNLNDTPKNVLSLAISPPNLRDVESCVLHLKEMGGLLQTCRGVPSNADGDITFLGRVMGSLPIDIRLSKLIILGHMFSCLDEAIIMAAGCTTRNLFVNTFHDRLQCYRKKLLWSDGSCSDLIILLNLYNVWLSSKQTNSFRTTPEEYLWCRRNYVNMKALREWDILIKEINTRLKNFNIEKPVGISKVNLSAIEKPTVLKMIICGAFYPHYFIRSADYGRVNGQDAVKILNGRDPHKTVYFTNMKSNQPVQIYVKQIKKMLNSETAEISYDNTSQKIFVEYKNTQQPEMVTIDGQQVIATISEKIASEVYEAVRMRQLKTRFCLKILPDDKAWDFANETEAKLKRLNSSNNSEVNCFSTIEYSPLPPLNIQYMSVRVTHVIDCGHFYCHNWNDETDLHLRAIYQALNGPGILLEPVVDKVKVDNEIYATMYNEDGKFYRCKVSCITGDRSQYAQVIFIDYGNSQKVMLNRLYKLPQREECYMKPIAMCCVLSEVQPVVDLNGKTAWKPQMVDLFKRKTDGILLNAKVYSVVDNIVHLELYLRNCAKSFNKWLIEEGHGRIMEESYLSKADHQNRLQVLENPSIETMLLTSNAPSTSYRDFDEPDLEQSVEMIDLKGPFNPLETKVCGVIQATDGVNVTIEEGSVNTVLLDEHPEDAHDRLIVAGFVDQSAITHKLRISQTTVMPNILGLPMIVTLLFCPHMEPKLTPDGSRVASILCGLGAEDNSNKAKFGMHDISLVLDTDLTAELIIEINQIRYTMNRAVKVMNNIYDEIAYASELVSLQSFLKEKLFNLLRVKHTSVDRVVVRHANVWNKSDVNGDVMVLTMNQENAEDDIWPLLWFVKLNDDRKVLMQLHSNLEELNHIAKKLIPHKPIACMLCRSGILDSIDDVRIHLVRQQHRANIMRIEQGL